MKKLVLFCAFAAALAFVGCKSNNTTAPAEATGVSETEVVAADSTICPETGKVCDQKAECEAEAKCEKAEAQDCVKKAECKNVAE